MNQTIGVNITPQSFQPTLHFSQGDVGRVFVVNVTDYDIPAGATVTCVATKPSGMGFTVSGTVSGNTVTFTSTAEMTDEWGRFPAEIRIASGNTLLGTANFLMIGEKDPHPASTIDGTQEELIPQLTLLVNRVEAAAESVHDLTVSASTLAAGSDATATYDSTNNSIAFGIPRGADGDVTRSEFNDLKSDLADAENGIVHIPASMFANGALQADGTVNNQQYYASTIEDVQFDYPIRISMKEGYRYTFFYKSGNSWAGMGWMTTDYFVSANTKFRLQIGRVTETWGKADLNAFSRKANIISKGFANTKYNALSIDKMQNGNEPINALFLRGMITNGSFVYTTYRICTSYIVRYDRPITITVDSGFRFAIATFNSEDQYVADLGWKTVWDAPANQGFKMVIARVTEDSSEKADVMDFYSKVSVNTKFKAYVDENHGTRMLSLPIMNNGRPRLVAHMGYRANAPENTIPAFESAGKMGYWGIESDLQQTSDGHYIMMHDTTLDRTTNGTGNISDKTLAEIRALHIKGYDDLKVPTFEEYLSVCKHYGCVPMIEIKSTITNSKASIETIIDIVKKYGFGETSVIFIGSKWMLATFKSASAETPFIPVYQNGLSYNWDTELAFVSSYKNTGLAWDQLMGLSIEQAEECHDTNLLFGTFTVDSLEDAKSAFQAGVDFVTTNTILPTD